MAATDGLRKFVAVLQKREEELKTLQKQTLQQLFSTRVAKTDAELCFCNNFLKRNRQNLTAQQQSELDHWAAKLCCAVDGAAVLPTKEQEFERLVGILQRRQEEFTALRKPNLSGLFGTREIRASSEGTFGYNFLQRHLTQLSPEQKEILSNWERKLCGENTLARSHATQVERFLEILQRRREDLVLRRAVSARELMSSHATKTDSDLRFGYNFLCRVYPELSREGQQQVTLALRNVLVTSSSLPMKPSFKPKLHVAETVLGDALPRSRQPKSLRQFYGNSQDAETRVMTFFNRVHQVDTFLNEMEFQHCDYCKIGWFGTKRQKKDMPGGFECGAFKLNVLTAPQAQWLDPARPICKACLEEAKLREKDLLPREPFRLTDQNHMDPGVSLPETDALTFFEEELLSPIQHIIRIFTLHATGQCELRGHVGNLFQNGPQYVREIPAAIGDMKMLLVRRCPKDPSRKQRVPFLVSRLRLERALDRMCKPLAEGGSAAVQPGALTPSGYLGEQSFVRRENLDQFDASEEGAEPEGLQVMVVEQEPWQFVEYKMFAMWISTRLELQLAAKVRALHEPEAWESEAERAQATWKSLRSAIPAEVLSGGDDEIPFFVLKVYLSGFMDGKTDQEVEEILHDEITAVQELASWEEPMLPEGFWAPEDMSNQKSEEELHQEAWNALMEANSAGGSSSTLRRYGADRISGLPVLDPPTVLSRNVLIQESQPYYIAAGFVKLFPLGQADYWAHLQARQEAGAAISFWEWLQHLLRHRDGRFQAHPRFYFFALNTALRNKALRAKTFFVKRQLASNSSVSFTNEELMRMGKAQFTKTVSAFEHSMPGSAQEKIHQRSDLEAMVEQIEQSTLEEDGKRLAKTLEQVKAVSAALAEESVPVQKFASLKDAIEQCSAAAEAQLVKAISQLESESSLRAFVCTDSATNVQSSSPAFVSMDNATGAPSASSSSTPLSPGTVNQADDVHVKFEDAGGSLGEPDGVVSVRSLLEELLERTEKVGAGGEGPCHFSTLTTAIYHWQDLAACLAKYEAAVKSHRGGRMDPLEPSERGLSDLRRRVLRYPGVVAWFTAFKLELFYKHVLQYEDGHAVFEWGAGGIMHLHSINWGSQMPRINPDVGSGGPGSDWGTVGRGAAFAEAHEEYITDWSWTKKEKWVFQEVDNKKAKVRGGSPVHTDSESDGSEDLEEDGNTVGLNIAAPGDVFRQHELQPDEDFVRLFPTAVSMQYVLTDAGQRERVKLSQSQKDVLESLQSLLDDETWHACQITVEQKALLMTNNCQMVRRVRRKWYCRLTQKCNMHDRHGGEPMEIPPIFVEASNSASVCTDDARAQPVDRSNRASVCTDDARVQPVDRTLEPVTLRIASLNLNTLDLAEELGRLLVDVDVLCLQEVTPTCVENLLLVAREKNFQVVSPLQRGSTAVEGFDVCMLLSRAVAQKLRVSVVPLAEESPRRMLQVQLQLRQNGALLAVGTCHLTAKAEHAALRRQELLAALGSLEALHSSMDSCVLMGDLNLRTSERHDRNLWDDAWEVAGSLPECCGTWCPEELEPVAMAVGEWRFDRLLFMDRLFFRAAERHQTATLKLVEDSFSVDFNACPDTDHALVMASLIVNAGAVEEPVIPEEYLEVLRPGLGQQVCKRPVEKESCVRKVGGKVYCGKDYEKPRMQPGRGAIVEDPRRKGVYRLYTRRNCHHVNTHDPLKAMGLVANVDDQVVLTVQAAVNYLTKYMGKLGGGHTATGRIGSVIDSIICKMKDTETMTVAALLSKLFIHAAVPEDISSLEAWHTLLDLPRTLSSRFVTALSKNDVVSLKPMDVIAAGNQDTTATRQMKVATYMERLKLPRDGSTLSEEALKKMSFAQFLSGVDKRGHMRKLLLRPKGTILKEKPYLQLDVRRHDAADMARYCLRLHRPFLLQSEDPMTLSDADAVQQLHAFVQTPVCPVWLQKRFRRHNRQKQRRGAPRASDGAAVLPANSDTAATRASFSAGPSSSFCSSAAASGASQASDGAAVLPANSVTAVAQASTSSASSNSFRNSATASGASATDGAAVLPAVEPESIPGEGSAVTVKKRKVINLSAPRNDEGREASRSPCRLRSKAGDAEFPEDNSRNRTWVAEQHKLLWTAVDGVRQYSVAEACRNTRPQPTAMQMRAYLEAITGSPQKKLRLVESMEKFVFLMLALDLQEFEKKGGGIRKSCLPKPSLQKLSNAYHQYQGSATSNKQKKDWSMKPYAELWNLVKQCTLKQCGLTVSLAAHHRVVFSDSVADSSAPEREGKWRQRVFCLDPYLDEHEEWEDAEEREAKRQRFVQSAMHEQSMGRPGPRLHEVSLPVDEGALQCRDADTKAEWDALNPYVHLISDKMLRPDVGELRVAEEASRWMLRVSEGGLSHQEAAALATVAGGSDSSVAYEDLDPTQASFVDHLTQWRDAFSAADLTFESNLPLECLSASAAVLPTAASTTGIKLESPVLLLGTAGTGKTTTVQVANNLLETPGTEHRSLSGRIVRCAYTGVAASNMGAGGRTIVSLFRLGKKALGGILPPLSPDEMAAMSEELGQMAVLEIDEVSMLEKTVLAHVHERLQQWRKDVYHPKHCVGCACRCGFRMPFGGVKVILAGDFGQLPPVAVKPEKTLLSPAYQGSGSQAVNLGQRLFQGVTTVFRLRRVHRQVGQSRYKESLLRLRDAAHFKEDVALWQSHDLSHPSCELTVAERQSFEDRPHLFCETRRAGEFNGKKLGEQAEKSAQADGILRIWSVDSSPMVERFAADSLGGLRRVLHVAVGAKVMLTRNLRTVWNLVNGARGTVVATLACTTARDDSCTASSTQASSQDPRNAVEVGGVPASAVDFIVVDFPNYVGPEMVEGHPTWVCIPKQRSRHEKLPSYNRQQFPLVLAYGITVHKSQGLTFPDGCVFNMAHEPTWSPCKSQPGLAFVGMSRARDFATMAFKYVPDYWTFRSVAETELFKWRADLELRLDELHDATASKIFGGRSTVEDDVRRHVTWTEGRREKKLAEEEVADLRHMLSVRGMLQAPVYTDKPVRARATKAGGGRNKRKVMRAEARDRVEEAVDEPNSGEEDLEALEEAYWRERLEQDERERRWADALADEDPDF